MNALIVGQGLGSTGFKHDYPWQVEFSTGLKITTRPERDPPARLHCFLIHLLSYAAASGLRLTLPVKQAARLTVHRTWPAMIHNKQYLIYNLRELCFIKKEAWGPTRPGSFAYFFRPEPGPNLRVRSGLRTLMTGDWLKSAWKPYCSISYISAVQSYA